MANNGPRSTSLSRESPTPSGDVTGVDLLDAEIERARAAAASGDIAVRDEALRGVAVAGAAAGVGSVRRAGVVEMPLPSGTSSFPATGEGLTFGAWLRVHGAARVLRDTAALTVLSGTAVV